MSTTSVGDLLARADRLTRALTASREPVSAAQWASFDVTLHQLLVTIDKATRRSSGTGTVGAAGEGLDRRAASADYPAPLRPHLGKATYTVAEAAQLLNVPPRTITTRVSNGLLAAHAEERVLHIDADSLHPCGHVPVADPADPHPLARLAVTLGALNDLLAASNLQDAHSPGLDGSTAAAVAERLLSVASVAARHTLHHGPIADAMRPLLIAQYADRCYATLARLEHGATFPTVAATLPAHPPTTAAQRLEAAVTTWAVAARADLSLTVPSIDVIRNITNQAAHAHAVTAAVLAAKQATRGSVNPSTDGTEQKALEHTRSILGDGIGALREADRALANRTTAMRPSHEYASAARDLYAALGETRELATVALRDPAAAADVCIHAALRALTAVNEHAHSFLRDAKHLPELLIRSRLLFAPARTLRATTDRLPARNTGRLTAVDPSDPPDLTAALTRADHAVERTQREVFHVLVRETASHSWAPSPL